MINYYKNYYKRNRKENKKDGRPPFYFNKELKSTQCDKIVFSCCQSNKINTF